MFNRHLDLLIHSFGHRVYFGWGRRVVWTTKVVVVQIEVSWGEVRMEDLGYSLEIVWWAGCGRAWRERASKNDSWVFSNWVDDRNLANGVLQRQMKRSGQSKRKEHGSQEKLRVSKTVVNHWRWSGMLSHPPTITKIYPYSNLWNLWMSPYTEKKRRGWYFTDVIESRILRWRDYPRLFRWVLNACILIRERQREIWYRPKRRQYGQGGW